MKGVRRENELIDRQTTVRHNNIYNCIRVFIECNSPNPSPIYSPQYHAQSTVSSISNNNMSDNSSSSVNHDSTQKAHESDLIGKFIFLYIYIYSYLYILQILRSLQYSQRIL